MARRLIKKTSTEKFRCRKCGLLKLPDEYYRAIDEEIDSNLKMSVCKSCCSELLNKQLEKDGIIEKALLLLCRRLNIAYDKIAIEKTSAKMEELKKAEKPLNTLFGVYLQSLHSGKTLDANLMFEEPREVIKTNVSSDDSVDPKMIDWGKMWGSGFTKDEYEFLDEEYSECAKDRKTLKRAREKDEDTEDLIKQLQTLLKSANEQLKTNKDQEDEGLDTISSIIKIMESQYPAEYYKERGLYKDFDYDLTQYHDKHVTRAIKNFAANQKDFDFDMSAKKDDDDDINFEEIGESEESEDGG